MVAPITLTIKHIRGHSFQVEVDHEADTLGLKVLIWELQKIATENQRLVYAGRELEDSTKLTSVGVEDGSFIFLVESGQNMEEAQQESARNSSISAAVVPPAYAPDAPIVDNNVSIIQPSAAEYIVEAKVSNANDASIAMNMPAPNSSYEVLSDEQVSEERIVRVIALSKYVRIYCILFFMLGLLGIAGCAMHDADCIWASIIYTVCYLIGWIGTRKLSRCALIFPLLLTILQGYGGMAWLIYVGVKGYVIEWANEIGFNNGHDMWKICALYGVLLLFALLHIMITSCICKLMCRIAKLSRDEWCNARVRILSKNCCC